MMKRVVVLGAGINSAIIVKYIQKKFKDIEITVIDKLSQAKVFNALSNRLFYIHYSNQVYNYLVGLYGKLHVYKLAFGLLYKDDVYSYPECFMDMTYLEKIKVMSRYYENTIIDGTSLMNLESNNKYFGVGINHQRIMMEFHGGKSIEFVEGNIDTIDLDAKIIEVFKDYPYPDGKNDHTEEFEYDYLINTIPLPFFLGKTNLMKINHSLPRKYYNYETSIIIKLKEWCPHVWWHSLYNGDTFFGFKRVSSIACDHMEFAFEYRDYLVNRDELENAEDEVKKFAKCYLESDIKTFDYKYNIVYSDGMEQWVNNNLRFEPKLDSVLSLGRNGTGSKKMMVHDTVNNLMLISGGVVSELKRHLG